LAANIHIFLSRWLKPTVNKKNVAPLDKRTFIIYIRREFDAGKFLFSKYSKVSKIKALALEKSSASLNQLNQTLIKFYKNEQSNTKLRHNL
jgi:hypothetical protein